MSAAAAPATVAAVIDRIAALWPLAPDVEITLEANPSSVESARFADLAAADWLSRLHARVGHERVGEIERLAPTHVEVKGRRHRLL